VIIAILLTRQITWYYVVSVRWEGMFE